MTLRFVHAADLHLDSPLEGVTAGMPEQWARQVRDATLLTLDRLAQFCREQEVDLLLLAGDIFDQGDRGLRAQLRFRRMIEELGRAGIPVFAVHGNHDDLGRQRLNLEWPSNLHVFPPGKPEMVSWQTRAGPVVRVFGISYPSREVRDNYARRLLDLHSRVEREEKAASLDIALLHANVDGSPAVDPYAPVSLRELTASIPGFHYWALGHVHERKVLHSGRPVVAYPGNAQGRSFAEPGWRGAYLVTVTDTGIYAEPLVEFYPLQTVVWHTARVTVDELTAEDDLTRLLEKTVAAVAAEYTPEAVEKNGWKGGYAPEGVLLRVEIAGRSRLYRWLQQEATRSELLQTARDRAELPGAPWVWTTSLEFRVQPPVDRQKLLAEESFIGDLVRLGTALREELAGRAQVAAAGKPGGAGGTLAGEMSALVNEWLKPLHSKSAIASLLEELPPAELQRWVEEAESLLVEKLLSEAGDEE
ncbi:MAG: DNA repair exonuclease [Limnochordales bacterium]|nr:DNA repair exonuclease [Limnochordales bacterium]